MCDPDENPRHACGPVRVPTTSDAALRSSRGNPSSGHGSCSCSGIAAFTLHPPMQSVLNPSVPRLKPDDSTQTGSLQKPCKSFMSSPPLAPAHSAEPPAPPHRSGTSLRSRHNIKSSLRLIDALVKTAANQLLAFNTTGQMGNPLCVTVMHNKEGKKNQRGRYYGHFYIQEINFDGLLPTTNKVCVVKKTTPRLAVKALKSKCFVSCSGFLPASPACPLPGSASQQPTPFWLASCSQLALACREEGY